MDIKVYTIESALSQENINYVEEFFKQIEERLGEKLTEVNIDEFVKADFRLLFVASGGSEAGFLRAFDRISDQPCYILTSGHSNSLAASMEILSYLQSHGKKGEIIHGSPDKVAARIAALYKAHNAYKKLFGMKIGVIGEPSDWLIASAIDEAALKAKLGFEIVRVPMSELLGEYDKKTYAPNPHTEKLLSLGYDKNEVTNALYVYGAFRRIVDKYKLGAVSVRCFDLLTAVKTTGCLGLAVLNAEGVYGGCEGDIPSVISMAILGEVSGKPVFMCNPSRIDTAAGEMVFAHCTLPLNMPYDMTLTTHFESGIGVAIAGSIKEGACTVFKTSGDLSRHYEACGKLVENLRERTLCRSQIKVKLDSFSYFLTGPINNHHLVCVGDETAALEEFFALI